MDLPGGGISGGGGAGTVASRFVSQTQLTEAQKRREQELKEAYARIGQEPPPESLQASSSSETYDPRSLYERLQANKDAKQAEWDEKLRLSNGFRGIDESEFDFLQSVDAQKRREELAVRNEERAELDAFKRLAEERRQEKEKEARRIAKLEAEVAAKDAAAAAAAAAAASEASASSSTSASASAAANKAKAKRKRDPLGLGVVRKKPATGAGPSAGAGAGAASSPPPAAAEAPRAASGASTKGGEQDKDGKDVASQPTAPAASPPGKGGKRDPDDKSEPDVH